MATFKFESIEPEESGLENAVLVTGEGVLSEDPGDTLVFTKSPGEDIDLVYLTNGEENHDALALVFNDAGKLKFEGEFDDLTINLINLWSRNGPLTVYTEDGVDTNFTDMTFTIERNSDLDVLV
jgi:hypothetical protein